MARFFDNNEKHEKLFVLAPQTADDDDVNFLVRYNAELIEIFSSIQQEPLEIEAYSNTIASTDCSGQSAGLIEHCYKGIRRIIAGHIQFRSEAQAERAYALFNDTSIIVAKTSRKSNNNKRLRLELLYYETTKDDDDLLPPLLHIRGVPATIHAWFPEAFDTFRKYGQLIKCQRRHRCAIHQNNLLKTSEFCTEKHDPTIIVQYMSKQECDRAIFDLNGSTLFENCILSIVVKTATANPPEKPASDYTKRPSPSPYKTKTSTTGHVRGSHDPSFPSSPAPPSINSSNTSSASAFQQQQQQQRNSQQRRQQQQKPMNADEKPTISSPTSTMTTTTTASKQLLELKPAMDLCNIYIKHIDPTITSTDLFNLFKPFGRIISARVMEDPSTGESRGFGFVSYSHPTEAAAALLEMDGYTGGSGGASITGTATKTTTEGSFSRSDNKQENEDGDADQKKQQQQQWIGEPMSVRFHEPRVPRPERDYQQQVMKLFQSHLAGQFSFEHVLPAIADIATSNSTSVSGGGGTAMVEAKASGSGLVHHHQQQQHHHHQRGLHHHHHPVPPPLMVPPPSASYYTPYSPSPTHQTPPSQPMSPFTLQHHPYMFPHSPYLVPHSPSTSTNPYYYYYHHPQQQPITMAEYFSPSPPPPPHTHTLSPSYSPTTQQQSAIQYPSQIQQQHYQHHHHHYQRPSRYQQQQKPQHHHQHELQTEAFAAVDKAKKGVEEQQDILAPVTSSFEGTVEEHHDDRTSITSVAVSEGGSTTTTATATKTEAAAEAIVRAGSPLDGGRQRLYEAVQQKLLQIDDDDDDEARINIVVDKLMATLSRKERSLCLFNEDYLQHRIEQVLDDERQQ